MQRFALLALALVLAAAPALAQSQTVRIRGTISGVDGDVVTIATVSGPKKVTLSPDASVRVVTRVAPADIKPGSFIGTTAEPQPDGTLKALEIHVFPPALAANKPGEGGPRPWDLTPTSTMTNATVTDIANATVQGVANRTLTLTYPGGQKTVLITPATQIVTYAPADRSALVPGTKVFVNGATPSGDGYKASSITAGRNGVDPPM